MKVKINEKWFEGRYNDRREFIIPLSEEQDIIFFYKWQKTKLKMPKSEYVKDIEYKTICESGILNNCHPILSINEDAVHLTFDSYKTIEIISEENFEISAVITAAVDLMKRVNEGLEVEFLSGMKRTEPSEHYPIGQLGVSTKMTLLGLEENVFLGYQHCEDMLNPFGHLLAVELVMEVFRDKLKVLFEKTKQ
jgi:hypothetical protein